MPGFILSVGTNPLEFAPEKRSKLIVESISETNYHLERRVVNKFMDDRLFVDSEDFVIVTEGVILNKFELIRKYAPDNSFEQCVKTMYSRKGDVFFNEFRGSFSGLLYEKAKDKWLVYTDHIGDKQIFYTKVDDGFLFGSEIGFIVDTMKQNGYHLEIDKIGCYMALTHGFCIEDRTIVSKIHKLAPGHYYCLANGAINEIQYHRFSNRPDDNMSIDDAVEGIDRLFRQAVKRQFDKDREYGFRHIACLSGGLDSRMTVWVAHEMGYTDQLNITYSQSNYLDFTIAQNIATDLHHDFLFKPLDGGDCIRLIDEISSITYGSANFFGLAHGKSMEDLINYEKFGLFHTGQLGDVIIGSYLNKLEMAQPAKFSDGAYSLELIDKIDNYKYKYYYPDSEIYRIYNRGLCGISQGLLTFQENTESCSPFTDVDFMEFCFSIPLRFRFHHKVYFDWIIRKHPQAANYIWEETRSHIKPFENKEPRYMMVLGYKVPHFSDPAFPEYLKGFFLRRLGLRKKGQKSKTITLNTPDNMNPIDYWYATNPFLKHFLENYWKDNNRFIQDTELAADMEHLFEDCVLYDKLQCLSVLSAIKLIES